MNKRFDLITIGDSTIDTFIKIHEASVECDIRHEECKICVPYGSKIPVDAIAYAVAGNAANVAVGCSKLGLSTGIYTNLGDDDQGKRIMSAFKSQGVFSDYIIINSGKKSNLSVVLTFQGERTIFVYHQDWYYQLPNMDDASFVYLTSMGQTFTESNIMDEVCHYLLKSRARLIFAPGTYQLKADIKRYPKILEKCEVLIVNLEEAKTIMGIEAGETVEVKDLLSRMILLGPKIALITDGSEGSYATDGKRNLKAGIFPSKLVEKTGAGDAYSSGLVSALFRGEPLSEAMIWGTICASFAIREVGTQNGLLDYEGLVRNRKAVPELVAVEF